MPFTHLAFDIDGTLISSEYANMKALEDTLIKFCGSSPSVEELGAAVFGIPGRDALQKLGVADIDTIYPVWAEHVHDYDDTVGPFDGIPELLAELKRRGFVLGIVSSKSRAEYGHDMANTPLDALFSLRLLEEDTTEHKPHPEPMRKFLELAGVRAENVLFLGDRPEDMACAHGAGVRFAFARWGSHQETLPGADYTLQTPAELLRVLEHA